MGGAGRPRVLQRAAGTGRDFKAAEFTQGPSASGALGEGRATTTVIFPYSHLDIAVEGAGEMIGSKPADLSKKAESDPLASLEEELGRTDRMIQMKVAMNYLAQLIDPKYRQAFEQAERSAKTVEEMNRVIELAKKFIAQRTVVDLLGIE